MRRAQRRCLGQLVTGLLLLLVALALVRTFVSSRQPVDPRLVTVPPSSPPLPSPSESAVEPHVIRHCSDLTWTSLDGGTGSWSAVPSPQLGESGPYCVVYDWLAAERRPGPNTSVTLCTHATADSAAEHAPRLAAAWAAPVSLSVFVLPEEVRSLAVRLAHLRRCNPGFRHHVSVHLVYERQRAPAPRDASASPPSPVSDCSQPPTPEPSNRRDLGVPYPVNVARNSARRAAGTEFVLVSDAELVPSPGVVNMFMDMVERQAREAHVQTTNTTGRQVYVLPVFEVQNRLPTSKADLVRMARAKEAVWFHRYVCPHCQKFPGVVQYFNRPFTPGRLKVLSMVKREVPFHRWEPIYIGTQAEPFYDERLSWEGKQDKMTQMTELCLRGYRLAILDQAFLTHVPQPGGIRRQPGFTDPTEAWRAEFIRKNQRVYDDIMLGFKYKYNGAVKRCIITMRKVKV